MTQESSVPTQYWQCLDDQVRVGAVVHLDGVGGYDASGFETTSLIVPRQYPAEDENIMLWDFETAYSLNKRKANKGLRRGLNKNLRENNRLFWKDYVSVLEVEGAWGTEKKMEGGVTVALGYTNWGLSIQEGEMRCIL